MVQEGAAGRRPAPSPSIISTPGMTGNRKMPPEVYSLIVTFLIPTWACPARSRAPGRPAGTDSGGAAPTGSTRCPTVRQLGLAQLGRLLVSFVASPQPLLQSLQAPAHRPPGATAETAWRRHFAQLDRRGCRPPTVAGSTEVRAADLAATCDAVPELDVPRDAGLPGQRPPRHPAGRCRRCRTCLKRISACRPRTL